jgi:hypothetical protein
MAPFKSAKAYSVSATPIPVSRATWYRWEKLGLIKLQRFGGHTTVSDETIEDILSGKIAIPEHPRRQGYAQIKPKGKPRGRPRKVTSQPGERP